jgi:hypothetical protein
VTQLFKEEPGAPRVEVLVTAGEAYPELERAFLQAEREVMAGFRVFDLKTRLRSRKGRLSARPGST